MSVETNGNDMLKNLKDKIRQDEEVAIKSDLLLKMLEVRDYNLVFYKFNCQSHLLLNMNIHKILMMKTTKFTSQEFVKLYGFPN